MTNIKPIDAPGYYEGSRPEIQRLIPKNIKTFLDVGCAEGNLALAVKNTTKCETWGVEPVQEIALEAKGKLDKVIVATVEESIDKMPENYFDCITFTDVLEHLVDPNKVLTEIKCKLSKDGTIVVSLPNVRFKKNISNLVFKKDWKYENEGILDRTHLRFFTKISMIRMFEEAGYEVLDIHGINSVTSTLFKVLNFITFNNIEDMQYVQFAIVAKPI